MALAQCLRRGLGRVLAGGLALLAGLAMGLALGLAQAQAQEEAKGRDPVEMARAKLERRVKSDPMGVLEDAARAIVTATASGSGVEGLDAAGVERLLALERAAIRARALGDWLAADLDNDGAISAAEAEAFLPLMAARPRAGAALAVMQADANGDGLSDPAELRAAADRQALTRIDVQEAAALAALLTLDRDGDGVLTLAEARAATDG